VTTIYCTFGAESLPPTAHQLLGEALHPRHELLFAEHAGWSNLSSGPADPRMTSADIVFGQPDPLALSGTLVRWVQLTSAGYARYEPAEILESLARSGIRVTTSSSVYADPCAEHLLAMILTLSRRLHVLRDDQRERAWHAHRRRAESTLLARQCVLLLGYGAIAQRLRALLSAFDTECIVVRRRARGDEGLEVVEATDGPGLQMALGKADHLVSTLPGGNDTAGFMNAERFEAMKSGARFYNVGRGSTVDQEALRQALLVRLDAAYLDVTDPEPLPPDHPLWSTPRCFITPHTAGGRDTERLELVRHFIANLGRFTRGEELLDRVL